MGDQNLSNQLRIGNFIVDLLRILVDHRRLLSRFILIVTTGTIILALLLPKWYRATVSVFPAEKAELPTGIEGLGLLSRGFSAAKALSSLSGNPELDRYLVILKSSTVLTAVIEKFDLVKVYDITKYPMENAAKELLGNSEFTIEPEGNLTVTVYDKSPQRAADMANFFVSELNRVNSEILVQNAKANREFIEQRNKKNLEDLHNAEDALRRYQEKSGVIIMPENTSGVSAVAEIYAIKEKKEIELAILGRTVGRDHPTLQHLKIEVSELNKKIAGLPLTTVESLRLYRDVAIQQKIMEFLTPIYEQAKVEEKRQTPSVLILDKAFPPERKARPRVTVYALLGFVVSALIGLFIVFFLEGTARLRSRYPEQFQALKDAVVKDWMGLRPRRWRRSVNG